MSDTNNQLKIIRVLTVCAICIALLSFVLPFFSGYSSSTSGIECVLGAIKWWDFPELLFLACPVLCIIGIVCTGASAESRDGLIATIIVLLVGVIILIIEMAHDTDDPGAGFYLYEVMSLAAIVLSAVSLSMYPKEADGTPTPTPKPSLKSLEFTLNGLRPKPVAKTVCPNCGGELEKDSSFCRFCGMPINKSVPGPYGPNPDPEPAKKSCHVCHAELDKDAKFCRFCGTEVIDEGGYIPPVPAPPPVPTPKPDPNPDKAKVRKAVCPHCGARQSEDTIKCKYCGTSMAGDKIHY